MTKEHLHFLPMTSSIGAGVPGCSDGPSYIVQFSPFVAWQQESSLSLHIAKTLDSGVGSDELSQIADYCQKIANYTHQWVSDDEVFVAMGGDHSSAIGVWNGVKAGLANNVPFGLVWIDAHMDSHTYNTTPSGKIHGMPVACLLGHGDKKLSQLMQNDAVLLPENLSLVGVRSFESGEEELLQRLNVKIYYMDEVRERGIDVVLAEAIQHVSVNTQQYGISLDLDGIDPIEAPGVGSPVKDGISAKKLIDTLAHYCSASSETMPHFLGLEISEFNPHLDKDDITAQIVVDVLKAIF